tara:strand:+ start:173 stop:868 length:696 start_codon:yes stop_codon:yes gene_type:complete
MSKLTLFFTGETAANNTKVTSKASVGTNTVSFSQSTAARQPSVKSKNTNSKLKGEVATSISMDGTNFLEAASTVSTTSGQDYTMIFTWVDGDYTAETRLVSGGLGYYEISAGGGRVIFQPNAGKASARSLITNTTNGGTTAHTFGSDVEMLAIVSVGSTNTINLYNIDGDLISTNSTTGNTSVFDIDYILGASDGTKGLNGEFLGFVFFDDTAFSQGQVEAYGNKMKNYKD